LTTEDRVTLTDARAALARGRPVVLVQPPAVERAAELWELLGEVTPRHGPGVGPAVLIICADHAAAAEWATAAPAPAPLRVHAVTGLTRSTRIIKERPVDVVAGAALDLTTLVQRAALKLDGVSTVVVAWPETLVAQGDTAALDALLAETRDAPRVVLSWNPPALRDFLERHAPRALVVGALPVDERGALLPAVARARYCVVPSLRRSVAVRDALDALHAVTPLVWQGGPIPAPEASGAPDAVLCVRLPTRDELAALARVATPVVFVTGIQLPYLRSIATATPLELPSAADRARDRAAALRERIARLLTAGTDNVDAELALLDPLFERFDPAEVAAALLALLEEEGKGKGEGAAPPLPGAAGRVRVFVSVGRKDRAAAKDLVGALIREAGLAKQDIGRIEVRETFSLVELAAGAAERAVRGLTGVTIRGRRVAARLDRDA
jgi:hypothetical protein